MPGSWWEQHEGHVSLEGLARGWRGGEGGRKDFCERVIASTHLLYKGFLCPGGGAPRLAEGRRHTPRAPSAAPSPPLLLFVSFGQISLPPPLCLAERTFWKVSWDGRGTGPILIEPLKGGHKTSVSSGFYYTCRMWKLMIVYENSINLENSIRVDICNLK